MTQNFLSVRSFFCLLALAAVLALAGCGDSEDSSDGPVTVETGSLTKEEFIEEADTICAETTEKVQKAGERYSQERNSSSQAAIAEQLGQFVKNDLVPNFEEQIDQIAALGAPAGDEAKITRMLKELQKGLDDAQANPSEIFLKPSKSFEKAAELGQAYGFARCGTLT